MNCPRCGNLNNGSKFCVKCGASMEQSTVSSTNPPQNIGQPSMAQPNSQSNVSNPSVVQPRPQPFESQIKNSEKLPVQKNNKNIIIIVIYIGI